MADTRKQEVWQEKGSPEEFDSPLATSTTLLSNGSFAAVSLQERVYHANIQRAGYIAADKAAGIKPSWFRWSHTLTRPDGLKLLSEKWIEWNDHGDTTADVGAVTQESVMEKLAEHERTKVEAHRALRTTSWIASFYLITTDILGPFNAPYAFSTVGYAGGFALYILFGVTATFTSFLVLNQFLKLDSDRFPLRNYGDLVQTTLGRRFRWLAQALQWFQLMFVSATVVIAVGQALSLLSKDNLCFVVGILIGTIVCCLFSQIRSLKNFAWVGSSSVWLNVLIIILSMGFVAHSAPNYASAAATYGYSIDPPAPIQTSATVDGTLASKVNGAMNMISGEGKKKEKAEEKSTSSHGVRGLMMFPEMLAESKRPFDFWKSIMAAQTLILTLYLLYGCFVYVTYQGQYTLPVAFQGVSKYSWQSIGNAISLVTFCVAGAFYGHISCKVAYQVLFEDMWKGGPALVSFKGRLYWTVLVVVHFVIVFVVGTAIPQVQTLSALVGAAFLLQFTFTLPPLMQLSMDMQRDAAIGEAAWQPGQDPSRRDSWSDLSRWKRGFFSGRLWFKTLCLFLFLAALGTSGLGIYGSVQSIIAVFEVSAATSFSCASPV